MPGPRLLPVVLTAAAVTAVALSGHLGSLHAFAVNAAAGPADRSTYNLKTVRLENGATTVARWNPCQRTITYRVNVEGLPGSLRPAAIAEIQKGVRTLAADDGMTYRYAGTTTFVPEKDDAAQAPAELIVAVLRRSETDIPMADETLGFGGVVWATWGGGAQGDGAAVVRGYAILNADSFRHLKQGFGPGNSAGNLLLHELGHATALEHAGDEKQIMHADLSDASPAGYQAGDRKGLEKVGVHAGCLHIPHGVGLADLRWGEPGFATT